MWGIKKERRGWNKEEIEDIEMGGEIRRKVHLFQNYWNIKNKNNIMWNCHWILDFSERQWKINNLIYLEKIVLGCRQMLLMGVGLSWDILRENIGEEKKINKNKEKVIGVYQQ